eukprot:405351-Alexandrium_andersonii.AAC.1
MSCSSRLSLGAACCFTICGSSSWSQTKAPTRRRPTQRWWKTHGATRTLCMSDCGACATRALSSSRET